MKMFRRCWQLVEDRLRPWAVKASYTEGYNTSARVTEEAKKLRAFCGLPGVLQFEGLGYTQDKQAYIVMRQASLQFWCTTHVFDAQKIHSNSSVMRGLMLLPVSKVCSALWLLTAFCLWPSNLPCRLEVEELWRM